MRSRINALLTLLILAATATLSMQAASAQDASPSTEIDQPVLKVMQVQEGNETAEEAAERRIWNSFVENLDYQFEILNVTKQSNTTNESIRRDSMVAFASLLVLNSQGLAEAESIVPSEEFKDFHNYTISSMKYFNIYLYNMAKYFETRKSKYPTVGIDALNYSMEYYNLGKAEAEFIFE